MFKCSNDKCSHGKVKVETSILSGGVWFAAWLFTLGFLKLSFGKGLLALIIWPYYLGEYFSSLPL